MTHTTLAAGPSMDDHKIGPAGQTFGQLKQAVLDARAAFMASLVDPGCAPREGAELMIAYESASSLLRAAYTRVGLPYVAP